MRGQDGMKHINSLKLTKNRNHNQFKSEKNTKNYFERLIKIQNHNRIFNLKVIHSSYNISFFKYWKSLNRLLLRVYWLLSSKRVETSLKTYERK